MVVDMFANIQGFCNYEITSVPFKAQAPDEWATEEDEMV